MNNLEVAVADPELPTVSVLMITKDRRLLLAQALKSIAELDYPREKIEIVVVEDTDAPLAPVGVMYIARPPDARGFGFVRNISVQASRGEILAFTDDDCVVDRRWLQELVTPMLHHPDVAGVGGAVLPRNSSLLGICEHVLGYPGGGLRYIHAAQGKLVETHQLSTVNCAYRRQAMLEAGGFNTHAARGGEDYLLSQEVRKRHRCFFNPRAIVYHQPRGSLGRIFARFLKLGRGQIELIGFVSDKWGLLRLVVGQSLGLKYLGLFLLLRLARWSPLWLLAFLAAHYGYLIFSYRFVTRYIPRRDVLLAAPAVRFVADLGLDCGRAWGIAHRIAGRWRR